MIAEPSPPPHNTDHETSQKEPEGTIDPMLKTVSFWNGEHKFAALHYYGMHPMSYSNDGVVTHDFVGIARERRARPRNAAQLAAKIEELSPPGCAGNM